MEVVFSDLFVCLSVSTISHKVRDGFGRNFGGQVECVARTSRLDFGSGPNLDPA